MDSPVGGFRTPDEVAAAETPKDLSEQTPPTASGFQAPQVDSSQRQKPKLHWPPSKKQWLIIVGVLVLAGLIAGGFIMTNQPKKAVVVQQTKRVAKPAPPKTVASTLSGLQVDPAVNLRTVTGVMIENSLDSRPQSGLSQAGVVFEAIAEGGITRFLALFQDTAPADIGPIRSARPYYVQWALGFDAAYAHVGGSPEALANIRAWGVKDLDQFANSGAYHRISSRAAPHNVYSSIATLNQLEASKGYIGSIFTGFSRKPAAPTKQPNPTKIDLALSGPLYNVHYDYKKESNTYDRSQGGGPHIDANGSTQISPSVVIALVIPYGIKSDGHSDYATIGSGPVYIFQDGIVVTGTWTKASEKSQFVFADAAGKPITLNPGQTWVTALSSTSKISYTP
ncbi:MAG: DUF3048 domain-containing protein [Patescibacteria group bacterium]